MFFEQVTDPKKNPFWHNLRAMQKNCVICAQFFPSMNRQSQSQTTVSQYWGGGQRLPIFFLHWYGYKMDWFWQLILLCYFSILIIHKYFSYQKGGILYFYNTKFWILGFIVFLILKQLQYSDIPQRINATNTLSIIHSRCADTRKNHLNCCFHLVNLYRIYAEKK